MINESLCNLSDAVTARDGDRDFLRGDGDGDKNNFYAVTVTKIIFTR